MDTRHILRNAYDGNFEKAIQQLVEIAEQQQKEIDKLKRDMLNESFERLQESLRTSK